MNRPFGRQAGLKTVLTRRFTPIIVILIPSLLAGGCYSVEFFPAPDYPNIRREKIERVDILRRRPARPIRILGTLIFRDFTGDLADRNFRMALRDEARDRGAEGAWIVSRSLRKQIRFQSQTVNRRHGESLPAGNIQSRFGIVKIILFNYIKGQRRKGGEQDHEPSAGDGGRHHN